MKVLFAAFKHEYGKPELGLATIEYQNFFGTLLEMDGVEAQLFAVDEELKALGREGMNQKLIRTVEEQKPDLLFTMIFQEEIKKETIEYITRKTSTKTLNWFTDDHWRFPVFSRFWAPLFTNVVTTDSQAVAKYHALGINNVIKSQWGVNPKLFYPITPTTPSAIASTPPHRGGEAPQLTEDGRGASFPLQGKVYRASGMEGLESSGKNDQFQITFVGKQYGKRKDYIEYLKANNLPAEGYGKGWDGGVVSSDKMLEIFSNSKINLNFTESFFEWPKQLAKLFIKKELGKYKPNFQFSLLRQGFGGQAISNFKSLIGARRKQIKARIFEIPACGGFLLTGDADNLSDYYIPGKEIAIFQNREDLAEKCRYYLEHEAERQAIAKAGYERTVREHTYEQRFREIFKRM